MSDKPNHWDKLTDEQKYRVDKYILTLLAEQPKLPLFEKKGRQVFEQKQEDKITYQLEKRPCGKACKGCPHGPYWYAYWRQNGRLRSQYIGKEFKTLAAKRAEKRRKT